MVTSQDSDFWADVSRASGSDDVDQLRRWLRDPRERGKNSVRGWAAMRLGELNHKGSGPDVAALLSDHHYFTRRLAALALASIGSAETEPALIESLGDPDALVRASSAEALGRIGARAAREPLRERLADEDPEVRFRAAYALVRLRDPDRRSLVQGAWDRETRLRWGRRRVWRDLRRELARIDSQTTIDRGR